MNMTTPDEAQAVTPATPELLPCPNPWCVSKSRPLPAFSSRSETWAVICGCGVRSFGRDTEAEAIAAWNLRGDGAKETVDLVRHWLMSGDEPVSDWEREFAAAIDARQSHSLPGDVATSPVLALVAGYADYQAISDDRWEQGKAAGYRELGELVAAALTPSAVSGDAGETLESIIAWGDQTFGPCSQERAIERAGEEWSEMEEDGADVPIEAADVIICLLRIPGILDAINRKMTINRGRTWDVRPDGTGYHVNAAAHQGAGEP